MNKTLNSVIFVVCATLFLSICTLAVFFALFLVYKLISDAVGPSNLGELSFIIVTFIFVAALLGGLFIYNTVLKLVTKKFDLEKYLPARKEKPKKPPTRE